ncbi:PEP-CTERM sorting domain-containing protein [Methylobacillus sp.]|uniref:PEP-CTERM sorting domain-containing protein n=1 Tax=Methylobacillus sp. TaxID=56818 RepID=UPI0012CD941E|nr:PEP-CTERM sorting domain-containing protein [Methylobacillus sp.]MPS49831.1 PEP-CTERM sorting domain-containing protein [Methylobacillus sp.]
MKTMHYLAAIAISSLFSLTSHAELKGTLYYLEPHDTISSTDSVVVNMRLTLNDDSDTLNINGADPNAWLDFVNAQLPHHWDQELASIQFVNIDYMGIGAWRACGGGSFTTHCDDGPPYDFSFTTRTLAGDHLFDLDLTLAPSESLDFTFGLLTPSHGPVAAGTYESPREGLALQFYGYTADDYDEYGNLRLDDDGWVIAPRMFSYDLATTCHDCTFTRTVVAAVPEPSSYALMGLGMGMLAYSGRRRKAKAIQ